MTDFIPILSKPVTNVYLDGVSTLSGNEDQQIEIVFSEIYQSVEDSLRTVDDKVDVDVDVDIDLDAENSERSRLYRDFVTDKHTSFDGGVRHMEMRLQTISNSRLDTQTDFVVKVDAMSAQKAKRDKAFHHRALDLTRPAFVSQTPSRNKTPEIDTDDSMPGRLKLSWDVDVNFSGTSAQLAQTGSKILSSVAQDHTADNYIRVALIFMEQGLQISIFISAWSANLNSPELKKRMDQLVRQSGFGPSVLKLFGQNNISREAGHGR
ncbi:hypothetical protein [Ponticaulis sp.]|uniref:hypothetical protein n=1 Tax=Ponticaulis sp. TaxID=2020902 RepID=UPI000B6AFBE9|nr:hypothetical protein [Ponticaulis sp.]MAJ07467.1 hypothetical protein [Ponticaulis sp.]RPG17701.1 MAG: hypothetical protein CBC85_003930 [Hyphomonadaceae bacterium TMED125]HBJ93908.1 hypothetical protein [Hyphomonadaceae bacterium]